MQEVAGVDAQDPLDPAWSPDGTRIAFSATHFQTGPENRDIYVFGIEDGELQRVTSSPAAENRPAWSPDGQHLAFLSSADGNSGVFVVSLTTGEISAVASGATEVYGAPTWVP